MSFNPPFTTCWYDSLILARVIECALAPVSRGNVDRSKN